MVDPGQQQLFEVGPAIPIDPHSGRVPTYEEIELTPAQIEEARREWPNARGKTPEAKLACQIHYMKMRVWAQIRHNIVLDRNTGRRAFGGPQDTRPKAKRRIDESLVEAADARVPEIIDAAFSALDSKLPPEIRHKAAMNLTREAREVRKQQVTEDEIARASRDDLAKLAAELLAERIRAGELSIEDVFGTGQVVDADVVDD